MPSVRSRPLCLLIILVDSDKWSFDSFNGCDCDIIF